MTVVLPLIKKGVFDTQEPIVVLNKTPGERLQYEPLYLEHNTCFFNTKRELTRYIKYLIFVS